MAIKGIREGASGWWTYWYKLPDGDITHCSNKKDIPKGTGYITHFNDGKTRYIIKDGKVVWKGRVLKSKGVCHPDQAKEILATQERYHKLLGAEFDKRAYSRVIKEKMKERCGR